jgi:predicted SAM-dependent methyltransferase
VPLLNASSDANCNCLSQFRGAGLWDEGWPLRLHLGCGEQYFDGYINIDYPPSEHNIMQVKADVFANLLELDFPPASVDEIRLHHVFEHFSRVTALAMLIRWHIWLKFGGRLHIETPDIMGSAKTLLSNAPLKTKMGVVRHLAGDQAAAWAYHIDHWFPERFEHTLQRLGFDLVQTRS